MSLIFKHRFSHIFVHCMSKWNGTYISIQHSCIYMNNGVGISIHNTMYHTQHSCIYMRNGVNMFISYNMYHA